MKQPPGSVVRFMVVMIMRVGTGVRVMHVFMVMVRQQVVPYPKKVGQQHQH
jgi:hypothetical protein